MTRFNKFAAAMAISSLFCSSAVLAAAGPTYASYDISLKAEIPTENFHVIPVESGWIDQEQEMGYDFGSSSLKAFEKQFQFKNTSGAIQATLTDQLNAGVPQMSNGTDAIPLKVMFNNIEVTDKAATVVTESAAKVGGRTALRISQKDSTALTVTGKFTGVVAITFEPVVAAGGNP